MVRSFLANWRNIFLYAQSVILDPLYNTAYKMHMEMKLTGHPASGLSPYQLLHQRF
jgi:hypothetical protein